jgi:hypothetical protein
MERDDMPVGVSAPMFDDAGEREFASGGRMQISGSVDASTESALMKALPKGKRR